MGRNAAMPPIRPVIAPIAPLTSWSSTNSMLASAKRCGHDLPRIGDLALAAGHVPAVDQVHHDGDMAGLDDVEDVFAHPVERQRNEAEADDAAPEAPMPPGPPSAKMWPTP